MKNYNNKFFWLEIENLNLTNIFALILLILIGYTAFELIALKNVNALGTWSGQDTIHVPISWCVVRGSPAFENPNIPNPSGGVDTTTDEVLWRRHERVTDNIYINPAGITFRSAINDALHTSLDFPNIADPNTAVGNPGNLTLSNLGQEYVQMLNECERAWENLTINNSGVVTGIIVLNVREFVSGTGQYTDTTGIGKCTLDISGLCKFPYDGHLAVIDNFFMIPGVSSGRYNNDPFDEALGHELGHTLSLQHRNGDIDALMNTNQQHNGPGGTVSNIRIYNDEVAKLRNSALAVPGIERDPMNKTILGDIVQSIKVDNVHEKTGLRPYVDISAIKLSLDKKQNISAFTHQLFGLLPKKINGTIRYWTLLDVDSNKNTGSNATTLEKIGVPPGKFSGADLVILAEVNNDRYIMGNAWIVKGNTINQLSRNMVKSDIQTMTVHMDTAGLQQKELNIHDIPLYNNVNVILNNSGNFLKLDKPISIQAITESNGTIVDRLDDETSDKRKTLELKQSLFPQCFINGNATAGKVTTIKVSGLTPNSSIHVLLGPRPIANDTTGNKGNGTIRFTIPNDVSSGLHLITVGVDNTALTADCEINVQNQTKTIK